MHYLHLSGYFTCQTRTPVKNIAMGTSQHHAQSLYLSLTYCLCCSRRGKRERGCYLYFFHLNKSTYLLLLSMNRKPVKALYPGRLGCSVILTPSMSHVASRTHNATLMVASISVMLVSNSCTLSLTSHTLRIGGTVQPRSCWTGGILPFKILDT